VRRVCGDAGAPTLEQVGQLDYIEACAHEAMRLKPVAPQNSMQALRDTTLGDVLVREGQIVICLMRRDSVSERYIPKAAAFEPERWLADSAAVSGGRAGTDAVAKAAGAAKRISMPFGAGPRICPGRYLALLEMKMAMATLLKDFDIQSVGTANGSEPAEHLSFTMTPLGLQMRLRARG
jgi:cytochrome P450